MKFSEIIDVLESYEMRIIGNPETENDIAIEFWSPLGEDFVFVITHNGTPEDFRRQFIQYYEDFDPDDHAADMIPYRGSHGIPSSVRALVDDAYAIDEILAQAGVALRQLI